MKRSGPIQLTQHADWSTWRDLQIPLDEPATEVFLIRLEAQFRRTLTAFQSMEFEPRRPVVVVVLNEPLDDADVVTAEVDGCIAAAGGA